jgi:endonuclease/exonuclease/phosphatase family metal-dependent hydrolase
MRVALYNQMFGLNGRNLFSTLYGHWLVHFQGNSNKVYKKVNLEKSLEILNKAKADIIAILEVLEGQEELLERILKEIGYKYICFGDGHKTRHSNLCVKAVLASKFIFENKTLTGFPIKNRIGGGGGFVQGYFPSLKLDVLGIHFASPEKRDLYSQQMSFLKSVLNKLNEKILLLGDFNLSFDRLKGFKRFNLASDRIKTCSITPFFRLFKCKDLDHILVKGLHAVNSGSIEGYSDHKLVYADLAV